MTSLPDALAACAWSGALEQRARLLEAVWTDLSSVERSVARATLPTLLVPDAMAGPAPLEDYAVDLALAPDGIWRVLRDRVGPHPGAFLLQAPLLAVFLPALCHKLLGQSLLLPSWPALWFRDPDTRARLAAHPARFCIGDGLDPEAREVSLATAAPGDRAALQRRVDACPDRVVARVEPRGAIVRVAGRVMDIQYAGRN